MATRVAVILSSADKDVALNTGLIYPFMAAKHGWMDEVKVIIFGPSEKLAASDEEVRGMIARLIEKKVEVMACKWCSDNWDISPMLEEQGINVCYVGPVISQLIKDGWATLSF